MSEEKNPNTLEEKPFSYRKYKNGKISICWKEKEVMILKGKKADKFSLQMENASEFDAQMMMAKITGNFKHGNEREAKLKGK